MDQDLQRQQQQERQQRFEQEVQRQPVGLQSLFSALNPFHLFGGGPGGAAATRQGRAAAAEAATQHGNAAAADAAPIPASDRLPGGTIERFEVVQTSLRELEVSGRPPFGCSFVVKHAFVVCCVPIAQHPHVVVCCMDRLASSLNTFIMFVYFNIFLGIKPPKLPCVCQLKSSRCTACFCLI